MSHLSGKKIAGLLVDPFSLWNKPRQIGKARPGSTEAR